MAIYEIKDGKKVLVHRTDQRPIVQREADKAKAPATIAAPAPPTNPPPPAPAPAPAPAAGVNNA